MLLYMIERTTRDFDAQGVTMLICGAFITRAQRTSVEVSGALQDQQLAGAFSNHLVRSRFRSRLRAGPEPLNSAETETLQNHRCRTRNVAASISSSNKRRVTKIFAMSFSQLVRHTISARHTAMFGCQHFAIANRF